MNIICKILSAAMCMTAILDAQLTQTLPRGFDVTLGSSSSSFPFNNTADHTWQWHYDSSQFDLQAPIEILDIAIRADTGTSLAFSFPSVEVELCEASTDYRSATHSMTFAANILRSSICRTGPWTGGPTAGFVPMGLTSTFIYDPSTGNDFIVQTRKCGTTSLFGVLDGQTGGVGVVQGNRYGHTSSCSSLVENFRNNEFVIITQITYRAAGSNCSITNPAPAAVVGSAVSIDYDISTGPGAPMNAFVEWSTDAGLTFNPSTPGGLSVNPTLGIAVPATVNFVWDSSADLVGLIAPQPATIRVTIDDGMGFSSNCAVDVVVDNVPPPPTCTLLLAEPSPVRNDTDFTITPDSANSPTVDATFEYSTDGGLTFALATATAPGANPLVGAPIMTPSTFTWDSLADAVGVAAIATGVIMRATVDDGVSLVDGTCQDAPFDVDNTALCQVICGDCNLDTVGPAITDALTAAQIGVALVVPMGMQIGCCDVDASATITIVDALLMAQASAGLPIVLTCP